MDKEFAQKAKDIHAQERDTYNQKIRAQEARHADKVRGLKKELDLAKQEAQRLRGERNSAREEAGALKDEHNLVLADLEWVRKERDDMLQQIEPLLKQVEELKLERETSTTLGRERRALMLQLVKRAQRVYSCLSGENLGLHGAFQAEAPASHVFFYLSLVEHLEKVAGEVNVVVEGECRDLLT